ncbi:Aminotransferase class-III [Dillenia turbinata]|uniref:Aminotransferase class-III n=1 Tax=Dillenia turbinata TaxID=194707 RepID=A0AAN8W968_9MAGN
MLLLSTLLNLSHRRPLLRPLSLRLHTTLSPPSPPPPLEVPLSHPIYTVWGANTGVGKTLVSTGIAACSLVSPSSSAKFVYIKPVQTGFPSDSDSRFVYRKLSEIFLRRKPPVSLLASNHALKASEASALEILGGGDFDERESGLRDVCWYEERRVCKDVARFSSKLVCKTLFGWREAISPHLAAEREGASVEDSVLLETLQKCLSLGTSGDMSIIETAGGVASPGPSGTLQCDLYRPFRLPAILVGDGRLGGISATISAYETLKLRGYDVVAIIFEDHGLVNEVPLLSYLKNSAPVLLLPPIPQDMSDDLLGWFDESFDTFSSLKEILLSSFSERLKKLHYMPRKAAEIFWWPFTQHKLVPEENITVIDSRCGENFAVHKVSNQELLRPIFDACASWWTQGPDVKLQIELARDIGYAAARFGHVMFPENVHEPVLECAEALLGGVGKGWASRAFFSDNGSTAIEIALKMAFRKFSADHGVVQNSLNTDYSIDLKVLALKGSYHGDTLGAMEAQAPSSYTGFLQQPWYTGRGTFLDPPTVFISNGIWTLSIPEGVHCGKEVSKTCTFSSRDEIFDLNQRSSDLAGLYSTFISEQLSANSVIQGSGGMLMVDPLFQRVLVNECRNRKIPVIFDEVFTGFWRLGVESAAELLSCLPDIACFAKLLTGGVIPLAATLATDAVFDAFSGDSKLKALLHGHSYTAHAMGCTAASKSINWFKDPQKNLNVAPEGKFLRELWDVELVHQISLHPSVERVVALGTLCAIELQVESCNAGYASLCASSLLQKLREDGVYMRPLGNVIYLMCGPCTSPLICRQLLIKVYRRLEEFHQESCIEG